MKLVLVVPAFPKLSESFIVNKFLGLLHQGWDVHVLCQRSDPDEWTHFPELAQWGDVRQRVHVAWPARPTWRALLLAPGVIARLLGTQPRASWRYLRRGARLLQGDLFKRFYLDARLLALRPDIVHFEFGALAAECSYLKALLGCKVTASFRGYDLNYVGLDQADYYRPVWDATDGLHFLGCDLWQRAQQRGYPGDKVHVLIPPAIDAAFFAPGEQNGNDHGPHPLRILSVGRLDWVKGYEYALQAIQALMARGVSCTYRIVGEGSYLKPIAFCRHELGLEDVVDLLGGQSKDAVRAQMTWADVFLHAAVSEGFCNVVIEAQAMQLPIVCSDAGGLPENVADGETGFVVPRRNPAALADKLQRLAGDPALRRRMGRAGRQRVLNHFQLSEQIAAFDRFYREIYDAH